MPQAASCRVGQTVSLSWSADDLLGLRWITGHWAPDTTTTTNVFTDERLNAAMNGLALQVPVNQPAGPISYVATARDLAERVRTLELTWTVLANEPPSATLSLADGAPAVLPAGGSTTVVVHAEDLEGLASVMLNATGPATSPSQLVSTSGTSQDITFTVTARPDATGDVPIVLQAMVTDISGVSVTTSTLELPVTPDTTPPVPAIDLSPVMPGDTYTGGDLITLTATATDDVGVTSLSIDLDGQTWTGTSGSLQAQWTAPAVTELTTYTATVEAADAAGNVAAVTRDVTVEPNDNASAPTAEILCPSEGALLPAGWDAFAITAEATDDEGVAKVEFYLGTEVTPFATVIPDTGTPATFTATATAPQLPTDVGEGVTLQYRVRAFDAANNHRDAFTTITVVEAVDLDPVEGYNDWAALADQMVVLRSGTLTLTAPRTVGGLIVLPGAKITYSTSATDPIDLTVSGPAYVGCGASVQVTGHLDIAGALVANGPILASEISASSVLLAEGSSLSYPAGTSPLTIDVSGTLDASGPVVAREVIAGDLLIRAGGTLSAAGSLTMTVAGDLVVEAGGCDRCDGPRLPSQRRPTPEPAFLEVTRAAATSDMGDSDERQPKLDLRQRHPSSGGRRRWHDSYNDDGLPGGGVIRLDVGGNLLCDGLIRANGSGEQIRTQAQEARSGSRSQATRPAAARSKPRAAPQQPDRIRTMEAAEAARSRSSTAAPQHPDGVIRRTRAARPTTAAARARSSSRDPTRPSAT